MYDGMYNLWWCICISYDGEPKLMYFLIEDDEIIKKYNDISSKVTNSIKTNFLENASTIKTFWKPK